MLSSPGGLADVSALGYITTRMAARAIQKHKEMLEKSSVKARRRSSSSAEAGGGAAAAAVGGPGVVDDLPTAPFARLLGLR